MGDNSIKFALDGGPAGMPIAPDGDGSQDGYHGDDRLTSTRESQHTTLATAFVTDIVPSISQSVSAMTFGLPLFATSLVKRIPEFPLKIDSAAFTEIPEEFKLLFDDWPEELGEMSPDRVEIYYRAYMLQDPSEQLSIAKISQHWIRLRQIVGYVESRYGVDFDKEFLFDMALGHLINGHDQFVQYLCYELDTMAFDFERQDLLKDQFELRQEVNLVAFDLSENQKEKAELESQIATLVNDHLSIWTYSRHDYYSEVSSQLEGLYDRIAFLDEDISERRETFADLESQIVANQKRVVTLTYKIFRNIGIPREELDFFLADLSFTPELIPTDLADEVSRAVTAVQSRAKSGSIEEVLYTDSIEALSRASSNYRSTLPNVELLEVTISFEAIEKSYNIRPSDSSYPVAEYYQLQESTLPEDVVYSPEGWTPILARGNGRYLSQWIFLRRDAEGSLTFKQLQDTSSFSMVELDFSQTEPMDMAKLGRHLTLIEPLTMTSEDLVQTAVDIQPAQVDLIRALRAHTSFSELNELGSELMQRVEPLKALLLRGPAGFTKNEEFLSVLQDQASLLQGFYLDNYDHILAVRDGADDLLQALEEISFSDSGSEFEGLIREQIAQFQEIVRMIDDEDVLRLCEGLLNLEANYDLEQLEMFLKRDGVILVSAITGGVLMMSGVGAVFGSAIFASIPGMALSASVMGFGSVVGTEIGSYVSGKLFDTGLESHFQKYQSGEMSLQDLSKYYMTSWATHSATTFMFMGGGRLAGHVANRMALSANGGVSQAGQSILKAGDFIQKGWDRLKFFDPQTSIGKFFLNAGIEVGSEVVEEGVETAAHQIHPVLGGIATTINCIDGRNIEVRLLSAGVTLSGQTLIENQLAMSFNYSTGKARALQAKIAELYPDATVTEVSRDTFQVDVALEGGRSVRYLFRPSQDPYSLRRAIANKIHDNYDGSISYSKYLSEVVGVLHERDGCEFRMRPDTDPQFLEQKLKDLGMVVYGRSSDAQDPFIMVSMGKVTVKIYTQPKTSGVELSESSVQDVEVHESRASEGVESLQEYGTKEEARMAAFEKTEQTGAEHSYLYRFGKYIVMRSVDPDRAPTGLFGEAASSGEREFFDVHLSGHIHPKGETVLPSLQDLQIVAAEAVNRKQDVEFEVGGWVASGERGLLTIVASYTEGVVSLEIRDPDNILWRLYPRSLQAVQNDLTFVEQSMNQVLASDDETQFLHLANQQAAAREVVAQVISTDLLRYDVQQRLEWFRLHAIDFDSYPEDMRLEIRRFRDRASELLQKMVIPQDGDKPIHFIIIEGLEPDAYYFELENGEKVVAMSLGLLQTIECDEELAFVFAHELEHGLSELQKKVNIYSKDDYIRARLLKRAVENEVDVKAVDRLIEKGYSPHAASDSLKRMRERYGDGLGSTHTMLITRANVVDAAISARVRAYGGNAKHRLDESSRHTNVIGNIQSVLFDEHQLATHNLGRAESLLNPTKAVDEYYLAIRDNHRLGFPIERRRSYESGKIYTISIFESVYQSQWQKIEALLPSDFDGATLIEYQLRLAKNLHEDFERAKSEILGADFTSLSPEQFEAMVLLEKRSYPIQAPSLVGPLQRKDGILETISEHQAFIADPERADKKSFGLTYHQRELEKYRKRLRDVEQEIEVAKALYEPGRELEEFVENDYQREQEIAYDPKDPLFHRTIEKSGLKVRFIHDLIIEAPNREKNIRQQVAGHPLLLTQDLRNFCEVYEKFFIFDLDHSMRLRVLEKATELLNQAQETYNHSENQRPKWRTLDSLSRARRMVLRDLKYYYEVSPEHAQAFAVAQLRQDIEASHDYFAMEDFNKVGDDINVLSPYLGDHSTHLIADFEKAMIEKLLEALEEDDTFNSALTTIKKFDDLVARYAKKSQISFCHPIDISLEVILPVDAVLAKIQPFTQGLDFSSNQLRSLIYLQAPVFIPLATETETKAQMEKDLIAISHNSELVSALGGRFLNFYEVMDVFCRDLTEKENQEITRLRVEQDRVQNELFLDHNNWKFTIKPELNLEQQTRLKAKKASIEKQIQDIENRPYFDLYDLLIQTPGIWKLKGEDTNERSLGGHFYYRQDHFVIACLEKLTKERPWDIVSASLFIRTSPYLQDFSHEFLSASFQWHLDHYDSVEEATYQFWKAVDDARMPPTYHQMNGIQTFIKSLYLKKSDQESHSEDVLDLEFFQEYRRGLERFAREVEAYGGAQAVYRDMAGNIGKDSNRYAQAGTANFEIGLRVNWDPIESFLRQPVLYKQYAPEVVAEVLLAYATSCDSSYGNPGINRAFEFLWQHKDANDRVRAVLLHPDMVRVVRYQASQVRIAKWQLEQISGFTTYMSDYELGRVSLAARNEVRDVVQQSYDLLKQQFPKPSPASHQILEYVEKSLLPGEAETKLLDTLRLSSKNWTDVDMLYGLDAPDYLATKLQSAQERISLIKYLIGITEDEPELEKYSLERIRQAKEFYIKNGGLFQTLALQAILADEVQQIDSFVFGEVKTIIMGESASDPALSALFDTYMEVLPAGERKILLAHCLAIYDPSVGGRVSLRRLLEAGGPLGAKAAQNLITSGVVTGELREDLMDSFDSILQPNREQIFEQLQEVFGDRYVSIEAIGRVPGSGSLNYVVEAIINTPDGGTQRVSIRIQKAYVSGQIENEYVVWQDVCRRLKEHEDPQVRRYGRLIGGIATQAYETLHPEGVELDLAQERDKYEVAHQAYAKTDQHPQTGLRVDVAKPNLQWQAMIEPAHQKTVSVYEYVDHLKLEQIEDEDLRIAIVNQIIDAEIQALSTGTFDPDGHKGNWLVDLDHHRLVRVDYAQLTTITKTELATFKTVLRRLMDTTDTDHSKLSALFEERFTEIFDVDTKPENLNGALTHVLSLPDLPFTTNPMEKLLFIQNQLEVYFANEGQEMELRLQPGLSRPLGSFLRLNMYRQYIGDTEYIIKLAEFLYSF